MIEIASRNEFVSRSHGQIIPIKAVTDRCMWQTPLKGLHRGFKYLQCRPEFGRETHVEKNDGGYEICLKISAHSLQLLSLKELHALLRNLKGLEPKPLARATHKRESRTVLANKILTERNSQCSGLVFTTVPVTLPDADPSQLPAQNETVYATNIYEDTNFPPKPPDEELREDIINAWINRLDKSEVEERGCAVCGRLARKKTMTPLSEVSVGHLELLREPSNTCEPATRLERSTTTQPIKSETGPILDKRCDFVCADCHLDLQRGRTPKHALVNGLWLGEIPDALRGLSIYERLLISKVRANMWVVKIQASGRRQMKGHVICYPQPLTTLNRILPPPKEEIEKVLAFVFMGPSPPTDDVLKKTPVLFRLNKVKTALEWLVKNHCDYADVNISEENLASHESIPVNVLYRTTDGLTSKEPTSTAVYDNAEPDGEDTDDCPFTVSGVTDEIFEGNLEDTTAAKLAALHYLRTGQAILGIGNGDPVSLFQHPDKIAAIFPWLFPYGLGAYKSPRGANPTKRLGFDTWARHMLMYHDKRFQMDESFIFLCFNFAQVRQSHTSARLCTRRRYFDGLSTTIHNLKAAVIQRMAARATEGHAHNPDDPDEVAVAKVLKLVQTSSERVYNSIGAKKRQRKQLWSVVEQIGAPTWFITVSPPEHRSPICLYYADTAIEINLDERTKEEARKLISQNPVAGARYFHFIVTMLIDLVLGMAFEDERGLFGPVDSYYGTVEQQGRLTLHIHMLVWIKNSPTPEEVRSRLADFNWREIFGKQFVDYLEATHTGDFLKEEERVKQWIDEKGLMFSEQALPERVPKKCANNCGECESCSANAHWHAIFPFIVNEVVRRYHTHTHSSSGCKKTPTTECKARYPRLLFPSTTIHPDGFVTLKKSEEYINTYNDVLAFLVKCNSDVQCLMSGTSVKAIIAYVTDYITKTDLRTTDMHECIKIVAERRQLRATDEDPELEYVAKGVLMSLINQFTAMQQVGSPMAAMFLLGFPANYTNRLFVRLYLTPFVQYVTKDTLQATRIDRDDEVNSEDEDLDVDHEGNAYMEQMVTIVKAGGTFHTYHTMDDYIHRPSELALVNLYNYHVEYEKYRITNRAAKNDVDQCSSDSESESDASQDIISETSSESEEDDVSQNENALNSYTLLGHRMHRKRKRRPTKLATNSARQDRKLKRRDRQERKKRKCEEKPGSFKFLKTHPDGSNLRLKPRKQINNRPYLVEFMSQLPRRDGSDRDYYCATMLTLLKPWRDAADLLMGHNTWREAFDSYQFDERSVRLLKNFNVLYECLDARHDFATQRKKAQSRTQWDNEGDENEDDFNVCLLAIPNKKTQDAITAARHTLGHLRRVGMLENMRVESEADLVFETFNRKSLARYKDEIKAAETKKILSTSSMNETVTPNTYQLRNDIYRLRYDASTGAATSSEQNEWIRNHAESIIRDTNLNTEQERAFRIIASETRGCGVNQLKMYLAGMGGTGKSRVINAVVRLFNETGRGRKIAVLAPTGSAAALIGGQTYHSYLGLRPIEHEDGWKGYNHEEETERVLKLMQTDLIIIDEVSMISCKSLFTIANKLAIARNKRDVPFGGVHMVFAGDFAQLPPVLAKPLYSKMKTIRQESAHSQEVLIGKSLWEQVTTVVILRANMRQTTAGHEDEKLRALLTNIRYKACTNDDLEFLSTLLPIEEGGTRDIHATLFRTTSVITATNAAKNAINDCAALRFAIETRKVLQPFSAIDKVVEKTTRRSTEQRINKSLSSNERKLLLKLPPNNTDNIPGTLDICEGMPVTIRRNDATSLGITNGAEGVIVSWDVFENPTENVENTEVLDTVFVKLINPVTPVNIGSLPSNVVPIIRRSLRINCEHVDGTKRTVNRQQIPINLNFAMTCHASQGKTRKINVVSLREMTKHTHVYTALSRGTSAENTVVLDLPGRLSMLSNGLGDKDGMKEEFMELELLDEITKMRFEDTLHKEVKAHGRKDLINAYLKHHVPRLPFTHEAIKWRAKDLHGHRKSDIVPFSTAGSEETMPHEDDDDRDTEPAMPSEEQNNDDSGRSGLCLIEDPEETTCAFDSVLQTLSSILKEDETALDEWGDIAAKFDAIRKGTITAAQFRGLIKMEANDHDPETFSDGKHGTSAYDAFSFLAPDGHFQFHQMQMCSVCGKSDSQSYFLSGLSTIKFKKETREIEKLMELTTERLNVIGLVSFIMQRDGHLNPKCECPKPQIISTVRMPIENVPKIFSVDLRGCNEVVLMKEFIFHLGTHVIPATYRIKAIFYEAKDGHITLRLFDANGDTWHYDGGKKSWKGKCIKGDNHGFVEESTLFWEDGPGRRKNAKHGQRRAAMVIYVKKTDDVLSNGEPTNEMEL